MTPAASIRDRGHRAIAPCYCQRVRRLRILQPFTTSCHVTAPAPRSTPRSSAASWRAVITSRCSAPNTIPSRAHGHLTWREHDGLPVVEMVNNWVCRSFADSYASPELTARIGQVLDAVEPDVVHAHSFLNLSFELAAAGAARGIPVVATLHDYTLVCPSGGQRLHRAEVARLPHHRHRPLRALLPAVAVLHADGRGPGGRARWRRRARCSGWSARRAGGRPGWSRPRPGRPAGPPVSGDRGRHRRAAGPRAAPVRPGGPVRRPLARRLAASSRRWAWIRRRSRVRTTASARRPRGAPRPAPATGPAARSASSAPWCGTRASTCCSRPSAGCRADAYELMLYGDLNTFPDYVAELRRAGRRACPCASWAASTPRRRATSTASSTCWSCPRCGSRTRRSSSTRRSRRACRWWARGWAASPISCSDGRMGPALRRRLAGRARRGAAVDPGRTRACLDDWARRLPAVKSIAEDAREWEATYVRLIDARRMAQPA